MKRLLRPALLFIAIGLVLYAGLYAAAEGLVRRTGHSNAFFKIAAMPEQTVDWLILGASHAMPLDFADFNAQMEKTTGLRIVNLAAPGAGPLYNRFVFEHFRRAHRAHNLLYVVDSFAFYSRTWNEDRFADAKLVRRTPFEPAVARRLADYARHEGVDPRAFLDYVSGFSKINNRERFRPDLWEGEAQFERAQRPSATAITKRIEYLYADGTSTERLARYLDVLSTLIAHARQDGTRVVVVKMPLPAPFRDRLPDEAAFDGALQRLLAQHGAEFHDFSAAVPDARKYFDTDHLNRAGLSEFFERDLKPVLLSGVRG